MKRVPKAVRTAWRQIGAFLRRLFAAVRHVRTGGQSTRTAAVRRARRPARRCGECGQPVQHSPDWRDHVDLDDCQAHGYR